MPFRVLKNGWKCLKGKNNTNQQTQHSSAWFFKCWKKSFIMYAFFFFFFFDNSSCVFNFRLNILCPINYSRQSPFIIIIYRLRLSFLFFFAINLPDAKMPIVFSSLILGSISNNFILFYFMFCFILFYFFNFFFYSQDIE